MTTTDVIGIVVGVVILSLPIVFTLWLRSLISNITRARKRLRQLDETAKTETEKLEALKNLTPQQVELIVGPFKITPQERRRERLTDLWIALTGAVVGAIPGAIAWEYLKPFVRRLLPSE